MLGFWIQQSVQVSIYHPLCPALSRQEYLAECCQSEWIHWVNRHAIRTCDTRIAHKQYCRQWRSWSSDLPGWLCRCAFARMSQCTCNSLENSMDIINYAHSITMGNMIRRILREELMYSILLTTKNGAGYCQGYYRTPVPLVNTLCFQKKGEMKRRHKKNRGWEIKPVKINLSKRDTDSWLERNENKKEQWQTCSKG